MKEIFLLKDQKRGGEKDRNTFFFYFLFFSFLEFHVLSSFLLAPSIVLPLPLPLQTDDKCVVLTCIKSTKSQVVLAKFVDCDGLCVLNDWLLEWRKNLQIDMLRHMLESVAHLPVTVASLKSSNFGKSLKKLTKLQG